VGQIYRRIEPPKTLKCGC